MLAPPLSLDDATPGVDYRVVSFRFGMVGDYCWSLGVRLGAAVQLRSRTDRGVILELHDGGQVLLDPLYARFVQLVPVDARPFSCQSGRVPQDVARDS